MLDNVCNLENRRGGSIGTWCAFSNHALLWRLDSLGHRERDPSGVSYLAGIFRRISATRPEGAKHTSDPEFSSLDLINEAPGFQVPG